MRDVSIRDALLELRQFVTDDAGRKTKVTDLVQQLSEAVDNRVAAAGRVVDTWTKLTGFNGELDDMLVTSGSAERSKSRRMKGENSKKTSKKKKKRKVSKKKSTVKAPRRGGRPSAQGYPIELDETLALSPLEASLVGLLRKRWPLFTSPAMLAYKNIISAPNQSGATINRLRKKGLPIESAKQARQNDSEISTKQVGYRLIAATE